MLVAKQIARLAVSRVRFEMRTTLVEAMFCATLGQTHIIVSDVDLLDVTHGGFCLRIDMGRG
jgi:hypothetical protein